MLGLDNAGKTSILYKILSGENIITTPTIGFNVESIHPDPNSKVCDRLSNKTVFTVWDIGGQERIRSLWRYYYEGTDIIVFVVDASDTQRIQEAADSLHSVLLNQELSDVPLLVLANK